MLWIRIMSVGVWHKHVDVHTFYATCQFFSRPNLEKKNGIVNVTVSLLHRYSPKLNAFRYFLWTQSAWFKDVVIHDFLAMFDLLREKNSYILIIFFFAPNPSLQDSDRTINYVVVCDSNGKSWNLNVLSIQTQLLAMSDLPSEIRVLCTKSGVVWLLVVLSNVRLLAVRSSSGRSWNGSGSVTQQSSSWITGFPRPPRDTATSPLSFRCALKRLKAQVLCLWFSRHSCQLSNQEWLNIKH